MAQQLELNQQFEEGNLRRESTLVDTDDNQTPAITSELPSTPQPLFPG